MLKWNYGSICIIRNCRSACQDLKVPSMRSDAVRNKKLIVQAAREVFATAGLAAPIDEIAQRAGVRTGTLYRHFPTKQPLFYPVLTARRVDLVAQARPFI